MASLKDVYDLIHSLDKREKRQFNLYMNAFAGKAKDNYLSDYQCFLKYKAYEKDNLKLALNKIKKRKNLSETNTNLYHFILNSLANSDAKKEQKIGFLKEIQLVEILFQKGLIEQSQQFFDKIKAKVSKSSHTGLQYHLFDIENNLLLHGAKGSSTYNRRLDLLDEQIKLAQQAEFILQLRKLKTILFALIGKIGVPRTEDQKQEYVKLLDNKVLQIDENELPTTVYADYFFIKHFIQTLSGPDNYDKAFDILKRGMDLIQKNINIEENYIPYYAIGGMIIQSASASTDQSRAEKYIAYYEKLLPYFTSNTYKTNAESAIQTAKLLSSLKFDEIEKGYAYIKENEAIFLRDNYIVQTPHANVNYLSIARICFLNKKYDQSLFYIEKIIEIKDRVRKSLLPSIYMLYLLNHYKQNNTMYLPYATRSLYRAILKNGQLYEPEKAILSFLKKTTKTNNLQSEIKNLYTKLKELKKDIFNATFFGNGDYLKWLKAEIEIKKTQH